MEKPNIIQQLLNQREVGTVNPVDASLIQVNQLIDLLINNMATAIVIEDVKGNIAFVNENFCQLFNIPIPVYELIGKSNALIDKLTADYFGHFDSYKMALLQMVQAKVPNKEYTTELIDGRVLELDYIPLFINNEYIGHVLNYKNVTNEVLSNKRLQAQQRLFETILNNLPVDVAVFSPDYSELFLNPIAIKDAELRRWMIDWLIGKDINHLTGIPENNVGNRQYFNKVLLTKNLVSWEEERENATGNETEYYLRNMFPVLDESGEIIMIIGYNVNITDRKQIEEQIKLSEKRYRDLINYSSALICTHDLDGKILTINPAISLLLEYNNLEMVGANVQKFLTPKSVEYFQENYINKVLAKGSTSGVFSVLSKSNQKYYLLFQNYQVIEEGREPYIVLFAQDITERIRVEKELLLAKKLTEEAAFAKEVFLANMSHEIRTPMNGIMGVTNFLKKTKLDSQQQHYVQLINDSANNLLVIVNDVLDFEKIASGKLELENIPFKIGEKLSNAVQSFQYKTEEKGLQLSFSNELPDDLVVFGDPYRLIQIVNNLINNAIKFTHEGAISVLAAFEEPQIESGKANVVIKITDTGIGIQEDRIEAIFKPYVQASSDTTRKYGGTGLGLTICKNLVDMLGGTIRLVSKVNIGTTFTIYLPYFLGKDADLPADPDIDIEYSGLEGKRVLVAEDVELNQFLAKTLLESWGCQITLANNGLKAVELVENEPFDVILMDVHMPEMDGISATKYIRQINDAVKSSLPIVALTANALKGTEEVYLDAGMNSYISKPYTEKNMFVTICKVLNIPIKHAIKKQNVIEITTEHHKSNLYNAALLEGMSKGRPDFVKRMVEIFFRNTPEEMQKLQEAIDAQDWELAGKTAHRMKPSIDGMGIESLKQVIRQIETFGKEQKNIEQIPTLNQTVQATLQQVLVQLKADFSIN